MLIQSESFWNLEIHSKIGFSIFIVLILGFGIIVQRQLISFLKCNRKRYVNQIISNNLILQNIFYPPQLFYYFLDVWGFNPCQRVGFLGVYLVYGLIYTGLFIVNYDRAHSLFINFFRPLFTSMSSKSFFFLISIFCVPEIKRCKHIFTFYKLYVIFKS